MTDCDEIIQQIKTDSLDFEKRVDEIKTRIKNVFDSYSQVPKRIFEWCDSAIPALSTYIQLVNGTGNGDLPAHKSILNALLSNGTTEIAEAQKEADKRQSEIFAIGSDVISLQSSIGYNSESLSNKISKLYEHTFEVGTHLNDAQAIREFEFSIAFVESMGYHDNNEALREQIIQSADELIDKCNGYRKAHE